MSNPCEQHILIVDDESALAHLMQTLLKHLGYVVDWAADGQQAIHLAAEHSYAAVICDLLMPTINGMELYETWQAESPELAARVIFTTGDNLSTRTNRFVEASGRPCLYKPFDVEDLTNTLDQVIAAHAD